VIVDTSALLAVIFNEEDEPRFADAMIDAPLLRMSAANWVETAIVVDSRRSPSVQIRFEDLVEALKLQIEPVGLEDAFRCRIAYGNYGRGHHRARLNYGDCFAYALAKRCGEPLLFKGNDFSHTDIEPALKG
jgi:ribonuclease VapC